MADLASCDAFIRKWQDREPGMAIAERFCAPAQRVRFRLWGALLAELREATFELSDARVTEVKSAWWADELLRTGNGVPRHPLTQALADQITKDVPWSALARGVALAAASESRPADADAAFDAMQPFASVIVRFERTLFADAITGESAPDKQLSSPGAQSNIALAQADAQSADSVNATCAHLLLQRIQTGLRSDDCGRIPLSVLARQRISAAQLADAEGAPAVRDWAAQLLASTRKTAGLDTIYRAVRSALDRRELQTIARGGFASHATRGNRFAPLRDLWVSWRAARRVVAAN